jgi:mannitol 2-dehydrogenase
VGVQLSDEVKVWEQVKVRVLNASHLTLAYPALLLGHHEVAEAMRDPQVPVLLERFLDKIVLPLLEAPRDVDLVDYKNTVLERFSNEAMHDQLTRIASDGASKVPVYFTTTLKEMLAHGVDHRIPALPLPPGAVCYRARTTAAMPSRRPSRASTMKRVGNWHRAIRPKRCGSSRC